MVILIHYSDNKHTQAFVPVVTTQKSFSHKLADGYIFLLLTISSFRMKRSEMRNLPIF